MRNIFVFLVFLLLIASLALASSAGTEVSDQQNLKPRRWPKSSLTLDSSSFMRSSSQRKTNITTLITKLNYQKTFYKNYFKADLQTNTYLNDIKSFTPEMENLYISTPEEEHNHSRLTIGRRTMTWSIADDEWALGAWSPRFLWDPLYPQKIGLTGAFYQYKSRLWNLTFFATPISVPERGAPILESKGTLKSSGPFFVPLYSQVVILNQPVQIHYYIDKPSTMALIFTPALAWKTAYGKDTGPTFSMAHTYKPIHTLDLAADYNLNPISSTVDVTLHPRALYHHMGTMETGYNGEIFSAWISGTGEGPISDEVPANWKTAPIGISWLFATGAAINWKNTLRISTSYLSMTEDKKSRNTGGIELPLPTRFPYESAWKIDFKYFGHKHFQASSGLTTDIINTGVLTQIGFDYLSNKKENRPWWTAGIAGNLITTSTGRGWFGRYRGDDRIILRTSVGF